MISSTKKQELFMACIFERKTKDGETRYAALVRVKGYPRQTATFSRKTDAKRWAQQTESSIRSGKYFSQAEAKKHTFSELVYRLINNLIILFSCLTMGPY